MLRGETQWSQFGKAVTWWPTARLWAISSPQEGIVYLYNENLEFKAAIQGPKKLKGLYHSRFGTAMEVLKIQKKEYLAVSSPGLSVVDLFDSTGRHVGGISWANAQVQFGKAGVKLVGESLLFDGEILYVGAPHSDHEGLVQSGAVYVLNSTTLVNALEKGHSSRIKLIPNQLSHRRTAYGRFGTKMARSNLFILVGAAGNDTVYGYDRLTHKKLLTLTGEGNSGFGGHLLAAKDNHIAIGAATSRSKRGGEQSGVVYVYANNQRLKQEGDSAYGHFGHSGTIAGHALYVGSPFADNARGALWRSSLLSENYEKLENGPEPYSGAYCDDMVSNGTHVVCTAPFSDDSGAVVFIPVE